MTNYLKLELSITADVSVENDTYNLEVANELLRIGAARLELESSCREVSRLQILKNIYPAFFKNIPNGVLWWLSGDAVWRPDNRVTRYKYDRCRDEFWISGGQDFASQLHDSDQCLRFFAATKLSEISLKAAADKSVRVSCSYLAFVPQDFDIQLLLEGGWESQPNESQCLLNAVCREGFLCKAFGSFDDPETGWLILGSSELVTQFGKQLFVNT